MALKHFKPTTPSQRELVLVDRSALWKGKPVKTLTEGLNKNEDGSVDVYFGPKAPDGEEANWLPTVAGKRFFLLFRFYGTKPAVFDQSWQLNDVEKLD